MEEISSLQHLLTLRAPMCTRRSGEGKEPWNENGALWFVSCRCSWLKSFSQTPPSPPPPICYSVFSLYPCFASYCEYPISSLFLFFSVFFYFLNIWLLLHCLCLTCRLLTQLLFSCTLITWRQLKLNWTMMIRDSSGVTKYSLYELLWRVWQEKGLNSKDKREVSWERKLQL